MHVDFVIRILVAFWDFGSTKAVVQRINLHAMKLFLVAWRGLRLQWSIVIVTLQAVTIDHTLQQQSKAVAMSVLEPTLNQWYMHFVCCRSVLHV
jgi:hypothetical protein